MFDLAFRKKSVAEGGVLWSLSQLVTARAARSTFGIEIIAPHEYDLARSPFKDLDGRLMVDGAWSTLVAKVRVPACQTPVRASSSPLNFLHSSGRGTEHISLL